jgi:hypothetical protein
VQAYHDGVLGFYEARALGFAVASDGAVRLLTEEEHWDLT